MGKKASAVCFVAVYDRGQRGGPTLDISTVSFLAREVREKVGRQYAPADPEEGFRAAHIEGCRVAKARLVEI